MAVQRKLRGVGFFPSEPSGGDAAAIALTQHNPVHLYQRRTARCEVRLLPTSLSGINQEIRFAKSWASGSTSRPPSAPDARVRNQRYRIPAAGRQASWTSWANLVFNQPNRIFQQLRWNFNNREYWNARDSRRTAFNINVHTQFTNRWWLHVGGNRRTGGSDHCDRCARGGPAVRQDSLHRSLDHHRGR